jgi:hypothetical protein
MLRKFVGKDSSFDVGKYLRENHFFSELQLESCYKLLYIFGSDINLAIGDALELKKLPRNWKGIWLYVGEVGIWINITTIVKSETHVLKNFVTMIEGLEVWLTRIAKESKMGMEENIAKLINLPAGWAIVKDWVRDVATKIEENWQNIKTPEWVAREMVRCLPDLKTRSRFLVLFNIELLDAIVKEGVSVSRITFGSDSALEQVMAEGKYKKLKTIPIGKTFDEMKAALKEHAGQYEVVLSNPPYQIMDGGFKASARPIYHEIVMYVIDYLKPQYVCMITPSRWMVGGKGLNDYRARMLNDKHIRLILDFPGNTEVFEDACISGGVSYFLWERDRDPNETLCSFNGIDRDISEFDVLVRDNTSAQILKKVLAKHTGKTFCDQLVKSRKPFGMATNFTDWVPEGTPGAVHCYINLKGDVKFTMPQNIVDLHGVLGKWKVLTSSANGAGQECDAAGAKSVLANTIVTKPAEACTETLIVAGAFNTKKEATNYSDYMKTTFYRFMLSLRTITQHITVDKFAWVPDFSNYSNPITDEELYEHFNLTKKEIEHIKSTIKEI